LILYTHPLPCFFSQSVADLPCQQGVFHLSCKRGIK
jgi:hypothetical protein